MRAPCPARDQDRSVFAAILEDLIARLPGALGAVLVDRDGEAVDYAGVLPPFNAKVAAAHLQLVRGDTLASLPQAHGQVRLISIRTGARTFALAVLEDGYSVVLILSRRAFRLSDRALAHSLRALAKEASWPVPERPNAWHPVEVRVASFDRRRPVMLKAGSRWEEVDVLGSMVGLHHECGYRVRLSSGAELTVVREASGHWYADYLVGGRRPKGDKARL